MLLRLAFNLRSDEIISIFYTAANALKVHYTADIKRSDVGANLGIA
jgi:hypothetical protein